MKLVFLPGMDGTGQLFSALMNELPVNISCLIIPYPEDKHLSYEELEQYVLQKLPKNEDFILVAESFSGPVGYMLARRRLSSMKAVIFVATFLRNPNRFLVGIAKFLSGLLFSLPLPTSILRRLLFDKQTTGNDLLFFKKIIKNIKSDILVFRIKEIAKLSLCLEKIKIKTYYIQALNDKLVPANNINDFYKISDSLERISIDGPHLILQQRPKECAFFILKKLKELGY